MGLLRQYKSMKSLFYKLTVVFVVVLQLSCCKDRFSSVYLLEMPQPPQVWVSLLGQPDWRVEFLDQNGTKQSKYILSGQDAEIELPITWTNPVTAWPYWPAHNVAPSFFKPAGGLFPFDVSGKKLILSWEAGPESVFYWELMLSNSENVKKIPSNFDWPRFRELIKTDILENTAIKDPWLIDWSNVAVKTINSNFDRRRLVPQTAVLINIPVNSGPWYGTSPFAEPLSFSYGETPVFPVRPGVNLWISAEGILRVNGKTWVFTAKPSIR
jgi:hypothetical protein